MYEVIYLPIVMFLIHYNYRTAFTADCNNSTVLFQFFFYVRNNIPSFYAITLSCYSVPSVKAEDLIHVQIHSSCIGTALHISHTALKHNKQYPDICNYSVISIHHFRRDRGEGTKCRETTDVEEVLHEKTLNENLTLYNGKARHPHCVFIC